MKNKIVEILGWYGTVAIIGAYVLVSFSILSSSSAWYQLLNLTGAIGIVIVSLQKKAYQPAVLNIIWTIIAVAALLKMVFSVS